MPHLDYTNDLRRKPGETNDASELTDNLADVESLGQGFDHVNVAKWSLDFDNVLDLGGSADELRQIYHAFDTGYAIVANNTWTGSGTLDVTVDCVDTVSGIFIFGSGHTGAGVIGSTHDIGIFIDGAGTPSWESQKGEGGLLGEGLVYAFEATAASHQVELKFRISAGAALNVTRATLMVFVVNR